MATGTGLLIALSGLGAIGALFAAAVINSVISPVLIAAIVIVSNDPRVLGRHRSGVIANTLGITAACVMGLASLAMVVTFFLA